MTEDDQRELIVLRREYGIGAHEALYVLPAWEINLLLSAREEVNDGA